MKMNKYLYWSYYTPELEEKPNMMFAFFDISEYRNHHAFIYTQKNFIPNITDEFFQEHVADYIYRISKLEEDMILDNMGPRGKNTYANILKEKGFSDDYNLYAFILTENSVLSFVAFLEKVLQKPMLNEDIIDLLMR